MLLPGKARFWLELDAPGIPAVAPNMGPKSVSGLSKAAKSRDVFFGGVVGFAILAVDTEQRGSGGGRRSRGRVQL